MFINKRNRGRRGVFVDEPIIISVEDRMRPVILPPHHFYKEKERLYNLLVEYSKFTACLPMGFRRRPEEFVGLPPDEAIQYELTKEELAEKDKLLNSGFRTWHKKDFYKFISGCEKFGIKNFKEISEFMENKTVEEIEVYSAVFWERKEELHDHNRFTKRIINAENKRNFTIDAQKTFSKKYNEYKNPLQ